MNIYIIRGADRYHLEAWYPAEVTERALCDLALDFHATTFEPFVGQIVAEAEKGAKGAPIAWKEGEAGPKRWKEDLLPALEHLIRRENGVTLGAERCARARGPPPPRSAPARRDPGKSAPPV